MTAKLLLRMLVVAFLLLGRQAFAQSDSVPVDDRAHELFDKGVAASDKGDKEAAYSCFSQAWELRQGYDIAANLGQAAYLLGKYVEAAERVAYSLQHYPATANATNHRYTEQLMALVRQKVASLALKVTPEDAEVVVDGVRKGPAHALPPEVFVLPGEHQIQAQMGSQTDSETLVAEAGQQYSLTLAVDVDAAPAPPTSAASVAMSPSQGATDPTGDDLQRQTPERSRMPLFVGGALTAVVLGTAIAFTVKAGSAEDDSRSLKAQAQEEFGPGGCATEPGRSAGTCRNLVSSLDDWESAGGTADVLYVTTGVLAAATVVAYFVWPTKRNSSTSALVTPTASPHGGGVVVLGNF